MNARTFSGRSETTARRALASALLALGLVALPALAAAAPLQLTSYAGNDLRPTWDPRPGSDIIAYQTNRGAAATNIFNLGAVQADGTSERLLATGPNTPFGIAAQSMSSWVGTTGLVMVNEAVVFHEYMSFRPQATTFTRTVSDGNDAAFSRELLISGGGGGGFIIVSRDGNSAVWRWSTSGGSGTQEVRTGSFASLVGQAANSTGTVIATRSHPTSQWFLQGTAIAPDGSKVILSEPSGAGYDLFMYNFDGSGRTQLTFTGASSGLSNLTPDFTPDGTHIAFSVNGDIWSMALDGSDRVQLTATPEQELWPTWAPDGVRFAYGRFDPAAGLLPANWNIYADRVSTPPSAVPEPATMLLLGSGLIGLAGYGRKKFFKK